MTIHTRHPNSAKPDKDQSTACTVTAVALLCVTVGLASGSAIGQSQMVALPSGSAIGQSQISQDRLVGTWAYESVVVEWTNGTRVATPTSNKHRGDNVVLSRTTILLLDALCGRRDKIAQGTGDGDFILNI